MYINNLRSKLISHARRVPQFSRSVFNKSLEFLKSESGDSAIEMTLDLIDIGLTPYCADPSTMMAKEIVMRGVRAAISRLRKG
jgi:hypothetical protein